MVHITFESGATKRQRRFKTMFDHPSTPDEGMVLVTFVDMPEAITFGTDEGEALLQAVGALETALLC